MTGADRTGPGAVGPVARPPVVVGVDGSDAATAAVRWAAEEATRRAVSLHLVGVIGHRSDYRPGARHWASAYEAVLGQAHQDLKAAARVARHRRPELVVECRLRTGHPADVLAAEAVSAQLLVVGHHGYGALWGAVIGSATVRLAAGAGCPLAVLPETLAPDEVDAPPPVVVGVDGSPASADAVAFAFAAAQDRHAALVAVHSWRGVAPPIGLDPDAVSEQEDALLAESLAGYAEKYPDVPVRRVLTGSPAVSALVRHGTGAGLLVLGAHRRAATGWTAVLGSVSQAVLARLPCPVVITRPSLSPDGRPAAEADPR